MHAARVLLVTPQPFFEDRGTPIAVACVVRALAEQGYQVDILAFPVGRPLAMPHVTIKRAANPLRITKVPIGFSARKLALDASLIGSFRNQLDSARYDVVHAVEEAAWFAAVLCPQRRVPFIYDMASAIPQELESNRVLGTRPAQWLLRATERRVVDRARQVICSRGLARRVHAMKAGTPVSEWCYPAFETVDSPDAMGRLRSRLGLSCDDRVVLYAGNFSRYQGVELLIDAFARIAGSDPRLVLVCVGADDTLQADAMLDRLPAALVDRVRVVPRVERSQMPLWLSMADCLVSPRAGGANLPLKVFEYLAAGRPIVATRHGSHESVLDKNRAILCEDDAQSLGRGIAQVFANPGEARRMAHRARSYAHDTHGWGKFSRFVNDIYDGVLPHGRAAAQARSRFVSRELRRTTA
jgi:glycosyltransferase involved in cell wall biosynthesis